MSKLYFIINPKAKNGYSKKVWGAVESELISKSISYTALFTERPGHAIELARAIAMESNGEKTVLIAVGGDGTIHEVINGTMNHPYVEIGFIPGGSGNDFSRGFQLPKNPVAAVAHLLKQKDEGAKRVDVGKITNGDGAHRYFINNMGAGFDALITRRVNHSKLKGVLNRLSLGNLTYAYFVIKEIFTYKCTDMTIVVDGEKRCFEKVWFITVSNQAFYGGGMKIAPHASPIDGIFDVTVVHHLSRVKFLLMFITVFWGGHTGFKEVEIFQMKNMSIQTSEPIHMHADGEYAGMTPVDIEVIEREIPVLMK